MAKKSVCRAYIEKHKVKPLFPDIPVSENTELIVVIPCYDESGVFDTLDCLFECESGNFDTEIILIINSFSISKDIIKKHNKETYERALKYASEKKRENLKLLPTLIEELPGHQTGAGVPRKIGMDEALIRFLSINKENGVIVSLDADCMVEKNYLPEIYNTFSGNEKLLSATIDFHHPVCHLERENPIRKSMELYEIYLHYYKSALRYCGYPYAYHTIGSAFAVRCMPYAQVGGMGKQQAGEDFYFLQKIFPLGKTKEIFTTKIYPAARLSDRVPFGTGPALAKMIAEKEIAKYTYSFKSFQILKTFFEKIDFFFKASPESIENEIKNLPDFVLKFLSEDDFLSEIDIINRTTATLPAFKKRFFNYFNAFKILKFLNFIHPVYLPFKEVKGEFLLMKHVK